MKQAKQGGAVADETFVIIWQNARMLKEAAELSRMTEREASIRAYVLRRAGVPLKDFRKRIDVEKLAKIARRGR